MAGGKGKTDHEAKGSSEHVHTDGWGRGTAKVVVTRPMAAAHLAGRRRERLTRDIYLGGAKAVGGV